jgi:predicted Zn finger-like uncharacterized protein
MLFTRCPDCQTTFRITTEALHKADGQVRCGRCSSIFNAYADLRENVDEPSRQESVPAAHVTARPLKEAAATADDRGADEKSRDPAPTEAEHVVLESEAHNAVSRSLQPAEVDESGAHADVSADQLQNMLEKDGYEAVPTTTWMLEEIEDPSPGRTRLWRIGSALAILLLALQTLHHFRAEIARQAVIGPALTSVYSTFGARIEPRWNVRQYEVLEWFAAAEPNASGQGNLTITARIRNRGPQAQPYPHVHVRLLDRWEATVGSRIFRPDEYLVGAIPANTVMRIGETTNAQLIVVDPGPDAYGFELDVCVGDDAQLVCAAEEVFK